MRPSRVASKKDPRFIIAVARRRAKQQRDSRGHIFHLSWMALARGEPITQQCHRDTVTAEARTARARTAAANNQNSHEVPVIGSASVGVFLRLRDGSRLT